MGTGAGRRGAIVITLGVCLLLLLLGLGALNAFNLRSFNPASSSQTLVFLAFSILAFLLFVGVLVLLVRNVLKLYADQRSRVLGTRLRTRMLWGAVLVSLVPLVFMFAFSYLLMNRAVDRWFSQPVTQMRDDANQMAAELYRYAATNARSEADAIAAELTDTTGTGRPGARSTPATGADLRRIFARHQFTLQGGFALVMRNGHTLASFRMPRNTPGGAVLKSIAPVSPDAGGSDSSPEEPASETSSSVVETTIQGPAEAAMLAAAQQKDAPIYSIGGVDYTLAGSSLRNGSQVIVGLPIPAAIASTSAELRRSADAYWRIYRERREVRNLYTLYLLLTTGLALFACCWLALNLSKQVTRPVESLADAMEALAAGDYARRVGESATEELGELVETFNTMASDLQSAHEVAERSTALLSNLNATLEERRTELETIIETIPNGVVTLSPSREILVANRAFCEMVDPGGQKRFIGLALDAALPAAIIDALDHLLRRAHRMGAASAEMEMHSSAGLLHLSATVALLEAGSPSLREHMGYVLVIEDATQLLRAQKQSAWKEVARRVAHEIKNPLTPISLNAELIRRHVGRLTPLLAERNVETPSPAVIERCTDVIAASVQTMRSLVDQFSALAEFPSAQPRPVALNSVIENSLALFAGRLGSIQVIRNLAPRLPLILADPEALKRALSNLIDNAAEAMQESLLCELTLSTQLLPSGMVELAIADTGSGLTDEMRERLFLPYFSTKQRGTGLGLAIAAKILQEHQGTIRAEKNVPAGARFLLELRPAPATEAEELTITETLGVSA